MLWALCTLALESSNMGSQSWSEVHATLGEPSIMIQYMHMHDVEHARNGLTLWLPRWSSWCAPTYQLPVRSDQCKLMKTTLGLPCAGATALDGSMRLHTILSPRWGPQVAFWVRTSSIPRLLNLSSELNSPTQPPVTRHVPLTEHCACGCPMRPFKHSP